MIPSDYCNQVCGAGGGSFSLTTGTCDCTNALPLTVLCNASCRAEATTATCNNGKLTIFDPLTKIYSFVDLSQINAYGSIDCSVSGSSVLSMSTADGQFSGYFGLGRTLTGLANPSGRRRLWLTLDGPSTDNHPLAQLPIRSQRILLGSNNTLSINSTASVAVLPNPVVCIKAGDSIVFDVSNNNYPVYVKDSLLNTNPTFDYSAFRDIQSLASKNISINSFAFTFSQNGTYVFQLAAQSYATTVVTVTPSSINCTTEASFVPNSYQNLAVMGVSANTSIVLSPDWTLVIGLLFGMMGLIIVVVGFLYYFRKKAWSSHHEISVTYRTSMRSKPDSTPTKGLFNKSKIHPGDPDPQVPPAVDDDLEAKIPANEEDIEFDEDMQVPELARHMQTHHDELDRRLIDQNDLLETLHASLKKEVDELKSLITASAIEMGGGSSENRDQKVESLLVKLKSDLNSRAMFDMSAESSSTRALQLLQRIMDLLCNGSEHMANEVTKELAEKALKANEYELPVSDVESSLLHDLVEEVEYLSNYVLGTIVPGIESERRRSESVDQTLNQIMKNGGSDIPPGILAAFHKAASADIETDAAYADLIQRFKGFSERSAPTFVESILSQERLFIQTIAVDLHKGNLSVVEDDRDFAEKAMVPYLEELRSEVEGLMQYIPKAAHGFNSKFTEANVLRAEALGMIDQSLEKLNQRKAYSAPSPTLDMTALAPLIEALKSAQFIPEEPPRFSPSEVEEDEESFGKSEDAVEPFDSGDIAPAEMLERQVSNLEELSAESIASLAEMSEEVVEAVLNSDISAVHKEELFTATENGIPLLDT